jgi:ferrous iron transport protein A
VQLGDLTVGERAKITGYEQSSNKLYLKKLLTMGLVLGVELQLIGIAPLGDPVRISLCGSLLCLRKSEANILKLEKL